MNIPITSAFRVVSPFRSLQHSKKMSSLNKRNYKMFMSTASDDKRQKPLVIIIAGPTAVGKSAVAAKLCSTEWATQIVQEHAKNNHNGKEDRKARGHIISADSVQVYQGVQIGANKPTASERAETPHHLIDIVDSKSICQYNAADWMRDTMQVLDRMTNVVEESDDAPLQDQDATARKLRIEQFLSENQEENEVLPVIVGGTMMYLQWLVHGRPDTMKPSQEAVEKAATIVAKYEAQDDQAGWDAAVDHASSLGPLFAERVSKLSVKDFYRLRRTLEVAYTVLDDEAKDEKIKQLYNGQRQGGLDDSFTYDVRCFFLCPDDRMAHAAVVDSRCEEMISGGLLKETTDLHLSGQLPEQGQQARAIGYRQTLDYLKRDDFKPGDAKAFGAYLHDFTTATRRYAKAQMQWFRKDDKFVFVPVQVSATPSLRVDAVANTIKEMCIKPRADFEKELLPAGVEKEQKTAKAIDEEESHLPLSARTKLMNEKQGKNMKFYQNKRHKLVEGSQDYDMAITEADESSTRMKSLVER